MMWPRLLFAVLLVAFLDAHADTAAKPVVDTAAQTIVHLLDYIGVDYPQFIKDGKVVDEVEYKEQTEFAGQVVDLLGKLPDVPQRIELLKQAACRLASSHRSQSARRRGVPACLRIALEDDRCVPAHGCAAQCTGLETQRGLV